MTTRVHFRTLPPIGIDGITLPRITGTWHIGSAASPQNAGCQVRSGISWPSLAAMSAGPIVSRMAAIAPMIGEPPEWAFWGMAGLLAFLMLLFGIEAVAASAPEKNALGPGQHSDDNCPLMESVKVPNTELTP